MDYIFDLQMTPGDMFALDQFMKKHNPYLAIEVGSWKGLSTMLIAQHSTTLYCVDTWKGADNVQAMRNEAMSKDVFVIFRHNMVTMGLWPKIKPMVMSSIDAARIFRDDSADLIFIDGDHSYTGITQDLAAWWPKVKKGGILCGHDLDALWSDCPKELQERIKNDRETDFFHAALGPGHGLHPGVCLAIWERFADGVNQLEHSSIWWVEKS